MHNENLSYFVRVFDCLSTEECSDLLKHIERKNNFSESEVGNLHIDLTIRKSKTFILDDQKYLDLLLDRFDQCFLKYCEENLADLYWSALQRSTLEGYRFEPIQVTKYDESDYYHWHVDQGQNTRTICRILSFVLYLNEDFDGGFTEFGFGKYKPKPGQVLVFPSSFLYPHCGTKVISGNKNIITTWITNLGFKDGN